MSSSKLNEEQEKAMLKAACSGDEEALNELIVYYEPEIRKIACKYFLPRADYEDLLQEGRLALYKAILSYESGAEIPFLHFLRLVVKRKLIDSLRAHNRLKHLNLNEAFSLNNSLSDEYEESFLNVVGHAEDPAVSVVAMDEARSLIKDLSQGLSDLERLVFKYHFVAGMRQGEISRRLGLTPKSLDNAIQRIRRKTALCRSRQAAG
ncbi:RNA polymerase sigma factor, sigma-70 family [Acididesulfobacillus acetoxydans]|uniref:RNA polymerase sigma factor SigS n=1 Tax=Acididesulfobacillus acetoxydans TaxID=1561005 RepID=A0A8S0X5P4_9FIRM|nr:sigma-70 family RNA polymerase sigma factor [Acididesulfobacillus acetoxydans]CAA7601830.1 RNA polymerase sigma factor, sigma-70 family [Acididesulfobacillus acetoxydans]CEJ09346.1 RNA polymerase factor sigma-70 [Acididesulfobacillus acetoxydans]